MGEIEVAKVQDGFAARLEGELVAFAQCNFTSNCIEVVKVFTKPEHRGKGFATKLMDEIVKYAAERELDVRPLCPFAVKYFEKRR